MGMLRHWYLFAGIACCILTERRAVALPLKKDTTDCPDRKLCDFLSLPGIWENIGPNATYRSVDPCCELRDYVTEVLASPEEPVSTQNTQHGILFLGDSVDRFQLAVICEDEVQRNPGSFHEIDSYWACKRGPFSFHLQPMVGVHPSGPYHLGVQGNPRDRIVHVRPIPCTAPSCSPYHACQWGLQCKVLCPAGCHPLHPEDEHNP